VESSPQSPGILTIRGFPLSTPLSPEISSRQLGWF
jgi:hypothetical protein